MVTGGSLQRTRSRVRLPVPLMSIACRRKPTVRVKFLGSRAPSRGFKNSPFGAPQLPISRFGMPCVRAEIWGGGCAVVYLP